MQLFLRKCQLHRKCPIRINAYVDILSSFVPSALIADFQCRLQTFRYRRFIAPVAKKIRGCIKRLGSTFNEVIYEISIYGRIQESIYFRYSKDDSYFSILKGLALPNVNALSATQRKLLFPEDGIGFVNKNRIFVSFSWQSFKELSSVQFSGLHINKIKNK